MGDNPQFSLPDIVIMLLITGMADAYELLGVAAAASLGLIPVVGWGIAGVVTGTIFVINIVVLAIIQFWLTMKGVRGVWFLSGSLLEFIPLVNLLPLKTVTLIITMVLVSKSEAIPVAGRALKLATKKL